ncbi:MAG: glycosyltransferase family 2 protein [Patescibacteria group bacterium]
MPNDNLKKTISLIVPCFNEEKNIEHLYQAVLAVWEELEEKYDYELIFIDDGSKDNTILEVEKLAKLDDRVLLLEFSRNFGKEMATSAGINYCSGDAAIMIDADLQYPIEILPEFVNKWEQGNEVVVGVRDAKKTKNIIDKAGSFIFYKIINAISDIKIESGALDFRLVDRKVINEFNRFTERGRMTRALIDWLGFKRDYVRYQEKPRLYGKPAYSFIKRVRLALSTFISQSLLPLKLAGYLGLFVTIFSGVTLLTILVTRYIIHNTWGLSISRAMIVVIAMMFLIGIVLMFLGLISLYIANIHVEVANRPIYVIRRLTRKSDLVV